MKAQKNIDFNEATKVCAMRGYYVEGEYCEEYMEDIEISALPEKAAARVDLEYDITTLYSQWDVFVVAKTIAEIEEFKTFGETPRFFHELLCLGRHDTYDGYMCYVSNLRTLRKQHKNRNKGTS
jgi:hypothetical protein